MVFIVNSCCEFCSENCVCLLTNFCCYTCNDESITDKNWAHVCMTFLAENNIRYKFLKLRHFVVNRSVCVYWIMESTVLPCAVMYFVQILGNQ